MLTANTRVRGNFDLRAAAFATRERGLCQVRAQAEVYPDLPQHLIVSPGAPEESVLLRRLEETSLPYRMHPYRLGVDHAGAALLREWITESAATDCTP